MSHCVENYVDMLRRDGFKLSYRAWCIYGMQYNGMVVVTKCLLGNVSECMLLYKWSLVFLYLWYAKACLVFGLAMFDYDVTETICTDFVFEKCLK